MSFRPYPEYKPSGVEWLGHVPAHWHRERLKHSIASLEQGWSPQCESGAVDSDEQWGVLKVGCVNGGTFNPAENKQLPAELEPIPELGVASGDLLISRANTRELVGSAAVAHRPHPRLMVCDKLYRLRFRSDSLLPVFVAYYLQSQPVRGQIELQASGASASMLNIAQETIRELAIARPPIADQVAIVDFLDSETARIDALVAEQHRLISLLQEKRQALISHAVTKGLDPAARMKDSGVEWLGEVPEHWEVGPLKRYWTALDCKHLTAEFVDEGIPLASIREVQSRWVDLGNAKMTTEHFYALLTEGNRLPRPGDLILSRNATVGEVAQVGDHHPRFAMGQDVVLLRRQKPGASPDFLQQLIRSPVVLSQLAVLMIGSTIKRVNVEEVRHLVVPWPPPNEQHRIATALLSECESLDRLLAHAERAIALLQERRTALISAAVTGRITPGPTG
jgi:type I restriction enzyme S subunit